MDAKASPSLDAVMKVAFCLEGRDKITKFLQYGSRGLAYYVLAADPKSDVGQRLSALYKTTQTSRKAFRLGKSASYYKKLLALTDNKALSAWEKYLQVIQNIGMFGFFVYDNMAFLGKAKIVPFNADEAAKRGGVLWFCANVCGFLLAVHNLNADMEKEKAVRDVMAAEEDPARIFELQKQLDALQSGRIKKFLAVLKVTCDLVVSSNTGGVRLAERVSGTKLHDGIIGPVGCVSALVVLYNTWPNAPKAKPAIEASK